MKLKTKLSSLDELNALPDQYKEKYVAAEDGKSWHLDEIEIEDLTALKANQERLLKSNKERQEEIKALREKYADIDPDKAREAEKKLHELEEKDLLDKGQFDELFAKRYEIREREHENQKKALAKSMEDERTRATQLAQKLQQTMVFNQLSMEAPKLGINADLIPALQLMAEKDWVSDEEGKQVWKENGEVKFGKDGMSPATMTDYLSAMAAKMPSILRSSNGTGSQGNGKPGNGAVTISREQMTDIRNYEAAKKQAADMKVPLQVTE